MTKTFCDRCGAEIIEKARFFKATHKHIINLKEIYPEYDSPYESAINIIQNAVATLTGQSSDIEITDNIICEDCAKSLVEWFGGTENDN